MEKKSRQYYRDSYIEGNIVRQPERGPERERKQEEKSREQIRREQMRRHAARQNQQRALSMNRGYVLFLAGATAFCCLVCGVFLHLQSDVTNRLANIATLESEIADIKSDNVATEKRLETTMNLDQIKAAAIGLGLVTPGNEQVRYYSVENSDYMNQYGEIPTN